MDPLAFEEQTRTSVTSSLMDVGAILWLERDGAGGET
jgi:hypothetical protein